MSSAMQLAIFSLVVGLSLCCGGEAGKLRRYGPGESVSLFTEQREALLQTVGERVPRFPGFREDRADGQKADRVGSGLTPKSLAAGRRLLADSDSTDEEVDEESKKSKTESEGSEQESPVVPQVQQSEVAQVTEDRGNEGNSDGGKESKGNEEESVDGSHGKTDKGQQEKQERKADHEEKKSEQVEESNHEVKEAQQQQQESKWEELTQEKHEEREEERKQDSKEQDQGKNEDIQKREDEEKEEWKEDKKEEKPQVVEQKHEQPKEEVKNEQKEEQQKEEERQAEEKRKSEEKEMQQRERESKEQEEKEEQAQEDKKQEQTEEPKELQEVKQEEGEQRREELEEVADETKEQKQVAEEKQEQQPKEEKAERKEELKEENDKIKEEIKEEQEQWKEEHQEVKEERKDEPKEDQQWKAEPKQVNEEKKEDPKEESKQLNEEKKEEPKEEQHWKEAEKDEQQRGGEEQGEKREGIKEQIIGGDVSVSNDEQHQETTTVQSVVQDTDTDVKDFAEGDQSGGEHKQEEQVQTSRAEEEGQPDGREQGEDRLRETWEKNIGKWEEQKIAEKQGESSDRKGDNGGSELEFLKNPLAEDDTVDGEFIEVVNTFGEAVNTLNQYISPSVLKARAFSKRVMENTHEQVVESFSPLVGREYAPLIASLISYGVLLLPLGLVVFLFERLRAALSLQKIILFMNVYLAAYFTTLLITTLSIKHEPMFLLFQYSPSSYTFLQILQALGYAFYFVLQNIFLISMCTSEEFCRRFSALIQWVVASLIGLHYYILVFHRAMIKKAPRIMWKDYAVYSVCFVVLCFLSRAKRVKKEYVFVGDAATDKKN